MKKPVVDYRQFRLSRLNDPQFAHLKLLFGWVGYFCLYFLTENLIPAEKCYSVHIPLDDMIPFCEWFVIPYVSWYLLIVFSLGYFALYNIDSFKRLSKYIIITQVIAMTIYIIFPSRQDLRPAEFAQDNILTKIVGILYAFDTNTGVCPSLHVGYSLGIASVWLKERSASLVWKIALVLWVILICISIMFVKQHSALDLFAALPMCLLAELVVYRDRYFRRGK
ncbi:MAG: phosphatidic acid phosphatase [Firmicutes bacterium]|nr:phosphatidic acid phosphatase [Bacillota bacterium]